MKCRNAEDFIRATSSAEFALSQFRSLYFSAPRIISSAHRVRNWSLYGTPSATRRSNRAFPLSVSRTIPEANSARSPESLVTKLTYLLLTVLGYFSFVTRCSRGRPLESTHFRDRKSTRLNSSHVKISYAVF